MTREQAYDLASEFFGSGLPHYIADWVVPAIMRAAEIERETCAQKCLERHANGRFKHDTRDECADAIRAMGE
jgi:hypothetical protein